MSSESFKNATSKLFVYKSYLDKHDLALDNLQGLICHKNKPTNQPTLQSYQIFILLIRLSNNVPVKCHSSSVESINSLLEPFWVNIV